MYQWHMWPTSTPELDFFMLEPISVKGYQFHMRKITPSVTPSVKIRNCMGGSVYIAVTYSKGCMQACLSSSTFHRSTPFHHVSSLYYLIKERSMKLYQETEEE